MPKMWKKKLEKKIISADIAQQKKYMQMLGKKRTTTIVEKAVVQSMDYLELKSQNPSDFFASSQPKSMTNWRIPSAVIFPTDSKAFFIRAMARLVEGVSVIMSGRLLISSLI